MLVSFWTPILLFISIAPAGNIGNCSCAILPSYPQRQGLCKSQLRLIPFSSPQPRSWGDIRRSEYRSQGKTILCASHVQSIVASLCDRAIWLEQGRIVRDGALAEVCAEYEHSLQSAEAPR